MTKHDRVLLVFVYYRIALHFVYVCYIRPVQSASEIWYVRHCHSLFVLYACDAGLFKLKEDLIYDHLFHCPHGVTMMECSLRFTFYFKEQ